MAGMDKLVALVNSFASAVLSVGREVGLNITLNKSKVAQGIKVDNICTTALIGVVGVGSKGTVNIMLNKEAFDNIISAMSGGMIAPVLGEDVPMSVIGELANMIGGRALVQSSLGTVDVTPPQLIIGENIKNVTNENNGMRSFTLPFELQPSGGLYLVLSFKID